MFFSSLNRRDRVNLVANHSRLEMVILGMDELRLVTSGNNGWRLGGWLQHFHWWCMESLIHGRLSRKLVWIKAVVHIYLLLRGESSYVFIERLRHALRAPSPSTYEERRVGSCFIAVIMSVSRAALRPFKKQSFLSFLFYLPLKWAQTRTPLASQKLRSITGGGTYTYMYTQFFLLFLIPIHTHFNVWCCVSGSGTSCPVNSWLSEAENTLTPPAVTTASWWCAIYLPLAIQFPPTIPISLCVLTISAPLSQRIPACSWARHFI